MVFCWRSREEETCERCGVISKHSSQLLPKREQSLGSLVVNQSPTQFFLCGLYQLLGSRLYIYRQVRLNVCWASRHTPRRMLVLRNPKSFPTPDIARVFKSRRRRTVELYYPQIFVEYRYTFSDPQTSRSGDTQELQHLKPSSTA